MEKDNYFELRGVPDEYYVDANIPMVCQTVLPQNKDARILDIGCGLGQYLNNLKKLGYTNCKGIDKSAAAVNYCTSLGLDVDVIPEITDYADAAGQAYDFIIMTHVLEHIEKNNIISTLTYIREKLLSPEGMIYLAVPNAQSNTGAYWYFEDFTHNYLFTAGSLLYVLRASGYTAVKFLDSYYQNESGDVLKQVFKKLLLKLYIYNKTFWNRVTSSSFHKPSPMIFSYELLCLAKK